MPIFLKGNYQLSAGNEKKGKTKRASKSLTQQLEESAMAKLGGSICFVMKGTTFVWTGDSDEKAGS